MYCRMREDLEKALGFTSSPAVDRIAGVLSVVIGFSVFSSVAALDKVKLIAIIIMLAFAVVVVTAAIILVAAVVEVVELIIE